MSVETSVETSVLRVVIVEDDLMMQLGLEQLLETEPQFELVGLADDGFVGVETTLKLKPDLVVMDIGLPRLDGIAATQQIKQVLPDIKVVILTSHTSEAEAIEALTKGADAYCIKGTNADQLFAAIAAAQAGSRYVDPRIAPRVFAHFPETVSSQPWVFG